MKTLLLAILFTSFYFFGYGQNTNCNDTSCGTLEPDWIIEGGLSKVCEGETFSLSGETSTPQANINEYQWIIEDVNGIELIDTIIYDLTPLEFVFDLGDDTNCEDSGEVNLEVKLVVRSPDCAEGRSCRYSAKPLTVILKPVANFDNITEYCVNETINFIDESCYADSYLWDFNSGATSTEANPSFSYSSPGVYNVSLTVENECGSDTKTETIKIVSDPVPLYNGTPPSGNICFGDTLNLVNTTDVWNSTSYWDLPDTNSIKWCFTDTLMSINSDSISIVFKELEDFEIGMTASNACRDSFIFEILHILTEPEASAINAISICDPGTVSLEEIALSVSGDIDTFRWQFIGGEPSEFIGTSELDFPLGGVFFSNTGFVNLEVEGFCGSDFVTLPVNVASTTPIVFSSYPDIFCTSDSLFQFTVEEPTGGVWDIEGIDDEAIIDASGNFSPFLLLPGEYDVTYDAGSALCPNSNQFTITVNASEQNVVDTFLCVNSSAQIVANPENEGDMVYNGAGITDESTGLFDPSIVDTSAVQLQYIFTDQDGCSINGQFLVEIDSLPILFAPDTISLCISSEIIDLEDLIGYSGDVESVIWSGEGIMDENNGLFDSSNFESGDISTVHVTLEGRSCSNVDSVIVKLLAAPVLSLPEDMTLCSSAGIVSLTANPSGGIWTSSNCEVSLDGQVDITSMGSVICEFQYILFSGESCEVSESLFVEVVDLDAELSVDDNIQAVCESEESFIFTGVSPAQGGVWSGTAIDTATGTIDVSSLDAGDDYDYTYCISQDEIDCEACISMTLQVNPLPIASFDNTLLPCLNQVYTFENLSQNGITYAWDFGDGSPISTQLNPDHIFTEEGSIAVTLEVTNQYGCVDNFSSTIDIVSPPVIEVSSTTVEGCAPLEFIYENNSTGVNTISYWVVQGDTIFSPNPDILLDSVVDDSLFQIEFIIENDCERKTSSFEVLVFPQPQVDFGIADDEGCSPDTVYFVSTSLGNPSNILWDFGNGNTSSSFDTIYQVYSTPEDSISIYTISLFGSNNCGEDETTKEIVVYPNDVDAFFEIDTLSGCPPLVVNISNYSSAGSVVSYDLGDGTGSLLESFAHTYEEPGEYVITQFVQRCGIDSIKSDTIRVFPVPNADFESPEFICYGEEIEFLNTSSSNVIVEWNFGDGTTSNTQNPVHLYQNAGEFEVTLTAYSSLFNCPRIVSKTVTVREAVEALIELDDTAVCPGEVIDFVASTNVEANYLWDFGDGNTSILESPSHVFESAGTYEVTLSIFDALFNCPSNPVSIIVTVFPKPDVFFDINEVELCQFYDTIQTNNLTVGGNVHIWKVNEVVSCESENCEFTFGDFGTQIIELISTNAQLCSDSLSVEVEVKESAIADLILADDSGCEDFLVNPNNNSENSSYIKWDFGDGNTSSQENPVHSYIDPGAYVLSLIAGTSNGCPEDTVSVSITVHPQPDVSFAIEPFDSCGIPTNLNFINQSTGGVDFLWDFGDGTSSSLNNPVHQYQQAGNFTINLTGLTEFQCEDSFQKIIELYEQPVVDIDFDSYLLCQNDNLELVNNSMHYDNIEFFLGGELISFEDGVFPIDQAGDFEFNAIASKMNRCFDTLAFPLEIKVIKGPTADFVATVINQYGEVSLENLSTDYNGLSWLIEEQFAGDEEVVIYDFDEVGGIYSICLVASNEEEGIICLDTICNNLNVGNNHFYIPNALSPNNDFGNELVSRFQVTGVNIDHYEISIYSPYGDLVMHIDEECAGAKPEKYWNGLMFNNGVALPEGSYVYRADYKFIGESGYRNLTGNITLIR